MALTPNTIANIADITTYVTAAVPSDIPTKAEVQEMIDAALVDIQAMIDNAVESQKPWMVTIPGWSTRLERHPDSGSSSTSFTPPSNWNYYNYIYFSGTITFGYGDWDGTNYTPVVRTYDKVLTQLTNGTPFSISADDGGVHRGTNSASITINLDGTVNFSASRYSSPYGTFSISNLQLVSSNTLL